MSSSSHMPRRRAPGLLRAGMAALGLAALPLMAGCTTVEGTNAFVNFETFEREVATEALRGIGIIDREEQEIDPGQRAPLVLPGNTNALPPPQQATAALPEDSSRVQIDASGLTEEDLRRLRNARVVDPRTLSGRPLTEAETRQLTARMQNYRIAEGRGERPNFLPPDRYFTTTAATGGAELVCLAPNGDLVPLNDPNCPAEVRQALSQ